MSDYVLLLIEASGIQEYIFGSNELQQNIGASERVEQATRLWIFETLERLGLSHNVQKNKGNQFEINPETGQYDLNAQTVAVNGLKAEVIYAGGGNALLLFEESNDAKELTRQLTRRVLEDAPGLDLIAATEPVNWTSDVLKDKVNNLRARLAQRKKDAPVSTPLVGLGVTAACAFTGLPAVGEDPTLDSRERTRLISSVVRGKLDARQDADKHLHRVLPQVGERFEFAYDFDLFGERGKSSYIAVVHTDGNRMGKRIENLGAGYTNANQNPDYARALREFSQSVSKAATLALQKTVDAVIAYHQKHYPKDRHLRFRPIVFGGDDVTFVCEGRLGLTLAEKYLREFSSQKLHDKEYAHARAGVAVVKSHFPFSRAYGLADQLCKSAKDYIKQFDPENLTAMDWHFAVSGLVRGLSEVRARECQTTEGKLHMRPYRLSEPAKDLPHAWQTFVQVMAQFQRKKEDGGDWEGRRNKLKALRDALRAGSEATAQFLRLYEPHELPEIPTRPTMKTQGWQGGECGYFDALEALDFYTPLN